MRPIWTAPSGLVEVAVTAVARVAEPLGLGSPVDLLRLPDVGATAAEAEGLEAHRLEGDVAGEHEQVGPGERGAVLLLHRPQQPAGLVEVAVVRPAVERGEALLTGARPAATVADAVGAGGVPRHTDEEGAVVPEVGGPPLLRVGHEGGDVGLDRREVEGREGVGVVEPAAERVAPGGVRREHAHVELVRPPVAVARTADRVHDRAPGLGLLVHVAENCVMTV